MSLRGREVGDVRLAESLRNAAPLLYRTAVGILRDAHAAEEACQQALLKAWERRTAIDETTLRGWLTKVVVNESLLVLRRRKVDTRARERATREASDCDAGHGDPWLRERLMLAMNDLPDMTRTVVILRIMHGMSGNEVKEMLQCSAAEVSRQLYAGMERLRTALRDQGTATPQVFNR